MERSGIRGQKEGVVQGRDWGEVTSRGQKEGVVQGRDWREVSLEDRRKSSSRKRLGRSDTRGQNLSIQGRDWEK